MGDLSASPRKPDVLLPASEEARARFQLEFGAADLNARIQRIEASLSSMVWKSEASVSDAQGGTLSFERVQSGWALCWSEASLFNTIALLAAVLAANGKPGKPLPQTSNKIHLRDASVEVKARAAAMLAGLIVKVKEQGEAKAKLIQSAASDLAAAEALLLGSSISREAQ